MTQTRRGFIASGAAGLVTLAAPPVIFYGFKHLFLVYLPS